MKHIKNIDQFINEQLFKREAAIFKNLFGDEKKDTTNTNTTDDKSSSSDSSNVEIKSERDDESSCPGYDCWTHFGKENFWNGINKIGSRVVPKITIDKNSNNFTIKYDGSPSGFLLRHAKGGKGDTIHQLLNVLTIELNQYLKTISAKPDVKNIKMDMMGSRLSVSVPLVRVPEGTHYIIDRRGGLGHGGDFSGLAKYKGMPGYEEAKHKSSSLTEKFITVIYK